MKLRARFPQIGLVRSDGSAPGAAWRRALWPGSRSGVAPPPEPPNLPAPPAKAPAPVTTSEFAPPLDWPSTVAAWRSTTGKPTSDKA